MIKLKKIAVLASLLGLSACAGTNEAPPAPDPVKLTPLEASAERIETMMVDVMSIEAGLKTVKTEGMPISISFAGDAAVILKKLADLEGKNFLVTGRHVASMPVSLEVKDRPIKEVLYLIGMQVGSRADVVSSPKAIELRFKEWSR